MLESELVWLESQYTPSKMLMLFAFLFVVGLGGRTAKHLGDKGATYKNSGITFFLAFLILYYAPEYADLGVLLIPLAILILIFRRRKKDDGA